MLEIKDSSGFADLPDGNRLVGTPPTMKSSTITFKGSNNILFSEEGVALSSSRISFNGSNSIVFLCGGLHPYRLSLDIYQSSVFFCGRNNTFTGKMQVVCSEHQHIFLGDDGLYARDLWLRNSDAHPLFSAATGERVNPSQSIFVGDHVWLGQGAMILKGTRVGSGAIVGAQSVVAGKRIASNSAWAGNPAKEISDSVFFDKTGVNGWTSNQTEKSHDFATFAGDRYDFAPDLYLFSYDPEVALSFNELDAALSSGSTDERLERLQSIVECAEKNRFALAVE